MIPPRRLAAFLRYTSIFRVFQSRWKMAAVTFCWKMAAATLSRSHGTWLPRLVKPSRNLNAGKEGRDGGSNPGQQRVRETSRRFDETTYVLKRDIALIETAK
jgi:hypothetical protein